MLIINLCSWYSNILILIEWASLIFLLHYTNWCYVCDSFNHMALSLKDIKAPIATEIDQFEKKFRASMKTNVMLLDQIMSYIVKRKGKQMRPMLLEA